jgi:hypothetical protein
MRPMHDLAVERPVVPDVILTDDHRESTGRTGQCRHEPSRFVSGRMASARVRLTPTCTATSAAAAVTAR